MLDANEVLFVLTRNQVTTRLPSWASLPAASRVTAIPLIVARRLLFVAKVAVVIPVGAPLQVRLVLAS